MPIRHRPAPRPMHRRQQLPAAAPPARSATDAPADTRLPCPHYPDCVGCALIGQPYGEQLRGKQQRVVEALQRYASLATLEVPAVVGAPHAFGYRNQAKLVARHAGRGLLLGIYRPGSHQVVDIRHCPVHHPVITRVLDDIAAEIERLHIPTYDERTHTGGLRYVVVRISAWTKSAQVILVTREAALPRGRELIETLRRLRGVVSVVQNVNPDPGNVIFGPTFLARTHETALIERIGIVKLKTHAGVFLQANIAVARKLYEHALRCAAPGAADVVIDLYCGVGALTFYLATAAQHVAGIEESALAIADAKENIRLNGFHNVRFYAGDVATSLPDVATRVPRMDIITLNPPRKGADVATRTAIVAAAPQRIVYVSCDPTTLARDLDWFAEHGYRTLDVQPFDLLPQTEHVECVATLERQDFGP